ncbi:protein translocase subunit SecD [Nocardioides sp. MAHUQ-72]|uniref:protein translocase subunit SecD n=1 Tax=unclassified Nocardioides TaxID=2615069 RepID=UPI00361FDDA9
MARKTARPGRTVVVFFLGLAIAYGLVALGGTWKPELGLDLQGGTRITLTAQGSPSKENLDEARGIIDARVNGTGVTEAEVTTQGGNLIVVEIPGKTRSDLVDTVKRQAQLRFRTVACSEGPNGVTGSCASSATAPTAPTAPTQPDTSTAPSSNPSGKASKGAKNRPPLLMKDKKGDKSKPSASPSDTASPSATSSTSPSATPSEPPAKSGDAQSALAFIDNPDQASVAEFNKFTCPSKGTVVDDPTKPLVTCGTGDDAATKYLLSPAAIEGTDLKSASAGVAQGQVQWQVNLTLGGDGKQVFSDLSRAMAGSEKQFAVVLDGKVISAPTFDGVIPNGSAQITGNFTEDSANSLATSLKYGALPLAFEKGGTQVETVGPSLAGDQLSAGITAGIIGLLLVMIYCLIYYRGLGLVVIASLVVAGAVTYAMVLLLSKGAGFTLSLPGIAGLIVAVGITADSFIVYFERIRDEMRDGKSMRVAVQSGWKRARNTCLAADTVSLLAAVVLYIFAAGVVKGFAFALGLSTLIDLAIFFWFTHPMVVWLSRFRFFNRGHKLSGLDAESLGIDRITVGGRA